MQRPALLILALLSVMFLSCCGRQNVFDEDAWYSRDVDADPTAWVVGNWLYLYDGQSELLVFGADGRYAWRLQLPRTDPIADVGEWYADRGVIELVSDGEGNRASKTPPARLLRVPTASGPRLVTPNLLRQWQGAGFKPGDYPRGGQAFSKVERN